MNNECFEKTEKPNKICDIQPEIIMPTNEENAILNELDDYYKTVSEMTEHERQFLNSIILRNKPKKLLEIGVSRGASSVVLLNAIKNKKNAKLYSIDRYEKYYADSSINNGSIVDSYPYLKNKWELYVNGLATDFIDEIGNDIDFCLIDTMHINPGEILDFLMVLPYLKEDAIIVFHDTNLHTHLENVKYNLLWSITNNTLMSSIRGKKFVQGNFICNNTVFSNIAAVKLNKDTRQHLWEIFNLLTIKWSYMPSEEDLNKVIAHFKHFYDEKYIKYLELVIDYYKKNITL